MTWLQLMRLPTVFTALADILCGFIVSQFVAQAGDFSVRQIPVLPEFWLLLLSSAGLYLGGMVLNDVFDAELDAQERPERPIPSGRISKRAASVLGNALMLCGVLAAWFAGQVSETGTNGLRIALMLAVAVVFYDSVLKKTILGPLGMGSCRFLNIMLGASCVGAWSDLWMAPQLYIAAALGVYIVGVTWFARNEAGNSSSVSMLSGLLVAVAGIGINAWLAVSGGSPSGQVTTGTLIALGLIAANVLLRGISATRSGVPRLIQKTVGLLLLSIIFLDATMTFCITGDGALASLVVILVLPARMLKRFIPMS